MTIYLTKTVRPHTLFATTATAILLLTSGSQSITHAQDINGDVRPYASEGLVVHGHAEIKAKPDVAYATLGVTTQARDQDQATKNNASRAAAVLSALKKSGIVAKDIQTQYYTVQPQYDYTKGSPVLTGYQVVNSIRVTVHDLTKVGTVLDKAIQAGATNTDGLSFDLTDRHGVEGQALVAAVADARAKADLLSGAAGVTLGRLKNLDESTGSNSAPPRPMAMRAMAASEDVTTPIAPQEILVTADVTAVYAIKP